MNQNSIHVLVKLVNQLPFSAIKSIYDSLLAHFEPTCCDKNGICIVKVFLEIKEGDVGALRRKVIENSFALSSDPFGNYAI